MDADKKVLRKWNELFEKYELDSIPKSSWKDICLIEMRKYTHLIPLSDTQGRLSNPMGMR